MSSLELSQISGNIPWSPSLQGITEEPPREVATRFLTRFTTQGLYISKRFEKLFVEFLKTREEGVQPCSTQAIVVHFFTTVASHFNPDDVTSYEKAYGPLYTKHFLETVVNENFDRHFPNVVTRTSFVVTDIKRFLDTEKAQAIWTQNKIDSSIVHHANLRVLRVDPYRNFVELQQDDGAKLTLRCILPFLRHHLESLGPSSFVDVAVPADQSLIVDVISHV